jgi:cell division protein FtsB
LAVARSPLTRQIVALGLALSVVALSLAYPIRTYLQQQAAEQAAVAEQHQLQGQIDDLKAQVVALKDPAYIRAEAKRRLQYVTPGDTVYVVKVPEALAAESSDGGDGPVPVGAGESSTTRTPTGGTPTTGESGAASTGGTSTGGAAISGTTQAPRSAEVASSPPTTGSTAASEATRGTTSDPNVPPPWYSTLWNTMSGRQG